VTHDQPSSTPPDDAARFMQLFASHQRRLFGFVFSLVRNETDADDVLQEALAVMWAKYEQFEPGTDFGAWAMSIVRLKAMELFAARKRDAALFRPETAAKIADRFETMGPQVDAVHEALSHCLAKLSSRDQQLVESRYRDDAPAEALAVEFSLSRSQIYRTLDRIHQALLRCIERRMSGEEP